jgi:hypothetical protein
MGKLATAAADVRASDLMSGSVLKIWERLTAFSECPRPQIGHNLGTLNTRRCSTGSRESHT